MAARTAFADWTAAMSERLIAAGLNRSSASTLALMALAALEGALILARAERSDDPILRVSESLGNMADEMA
jgi:TetR/AcrR family transcriptional repressor of lmrAB and yxaGH operons